MSTLVRRQPQQPRARFAPRSPPRFARRPRQRAAHDCHRNRRRSWSPFRSLADALRLALVTVLLRSPPSLRPALPRAVRSAPSAAQSPRRLRSAGFPGVDLPNSHTARIDYPTGRAGLGFHTPRSRLQGGRMRPLRVPFADLRRLWPPGFCWSERMSHRYTPIIVPLTAQGGACRTPTYGRNATEHGKNTDRYTTDIRRTMGVAAPLPAFSMADARCRSWNSRLGIALEHPPSSAPAPCRHRRTIDVSNHLSRGCPPDISLLPCDKPSEPAPGIHQ